MPADRLQPSLLDRLTDDLHGTLEALRREKAKLLNRFDAEQRAAWQRLYDAETGLLRPIAGSDLAPFAELDESTRRLLGRVLELEHARVLELKRSRAITMERLREYVRRDLEWLLNTGHVEADLALEDFTRVRTSTLNYGIKPLAGTVGSSVDLDALRQMLERAIETYEPRIKNVQVRAVPREAAERQILDLEIEGDLWGQTLPLRLYLRTLIDLDTGHASVDHQRPSGAA